MAYIDLTIIIIVFLAIMDNLVWQYVVPYNVIM